MNPEETTVEPTVEPTPTGDSQQMDRVIELLENIDLNNAQSYMMLQDNVPVFYDTSRIILTYGFVYVPLILIVLMLWWFFKQFLHKY